MIRELLDRDWVLARARQVAEILQDGSDTADLADLEDRRRASDALTVDVRLLEPGAAPVDHLAFIPNHPELCLVQALTDEKLHTGKISGPSDGLVDDDAPALALIAGPQHAARSTLLQPVPAQTSPLWTEELVSVAGGGGDTREVSTLLRSNDPFEPLDRHWFTEPAIEVMKHLRESREFKLSEVEPRTCELEPDARVILISDWGTGARDAKDVALAVGTSMAEAGARQCHIIHLGDVYYAGTAYEARHRFLEPWPVPPEHEPSQISWTLNGNHDMYAAGTGLFGVTLRDPRFERQVDAHGEPTSLFRLANKRWQILGLDSAWKFRLKDPRRTHGHLGDWQQSWLVDQVAGGRTGPSPLETIMLSHHEPVSRHEPYRQNSRRKNPLQTSALLAEAEPALTGRSAPADGVAAWFWGHEHRCVTLPRPAPGLRYGACIGNGAIPVPRGEMLAGGREWEYRRLKAKAADGQKWRVSGFAVIDFAGSARPTVTYVNQFGRRCRRADPL